MTVQEIKEAIRIAEANGNNATAKALRESLKQMTINS